MLYAELHSKLSAESCDFERSENILTSTVFGTLVIAEGGPQVLRLWLQAAQSDKPALSIPDVPVRYVFWPTLEGCIPDLALAFGDLACVVESKYMSGSSDIHRDDVPEPLPQLQTQWKACELGDHLATAFGRRAHFKEVVLVYVVDGVRGVRASRGAVDRARKSCDRADIRLLYWQDLHRALRSIGTREGTGQSWMPDLALLLENRQLGGFSGFPRQLKPEAAIAARMISHWRTPAVRFQLALGTLRGARLITFSEALKNWRLVV